MQRDPRKAAILMVIRWFVWQMLIGLFWNTYVRGADGLSSRAAGNAFADLPCALSFFPEDYDALTTSPLPSFPPEFHTTIFYTTDSTILPAATQLIAKLKEKRYFTDVANFDLRCGVCGVGLKGEKGAREHAKGTGRE